MKGVHYVTDDKKNIIAVQIEKKNKELWEDVLDYLNAMMAKKTKKISLEDFKKELKRDGKL